MKEGTVVFLRLQETLIVPNIALEVCTCSLVSLFL